MENIKKSNTGNPRTKHRFILNSNSMAAKDLFNTVKDEVEKSLRASYPTLGASDRQALSGKYAGEYHNMFVPDVVIQPPYALIVETAVSYSYKDNRVRLSFSGMDALNEDSQLRKIVAGIIKQYEGRKIRGKSSDQ